MRAIKISMTIAGKVTIHDAELIEDGKFPKVKIKRTMYVLIGKSLYRGHRCKCVDAHIIRAAREV